MANSIFTILVVEDEKNLGSTLMERLTKEGFQVSWAKSQTEALSEISNQRFHLALLDVGLPDGSGFEVAQEIRKRCPSVAMIFLTARGAPEDRIRGLELGAEDYVVKPFHLKELILRVRNVLRRASYLSTAMAGAMAGAPDNVERCISIGKARVYFQRFEAEAEGHRHSLTHKEASLLRLLVENRGKVVSRDQILNHAWSEEEFPTPRTVDNFIMRLRRLVEENPEDPQVIKSIRGVGYCLI